ncbi:MAG: hypothetical protein JWM16_3954 [Verrucomicrobiales bacterium]|nr:hypothetical protein [Verrucomicrobiales bacterium]
MIKSFKNNPKPESKSKITSRLVALALGGMATAAAFPMTGASAYADEPAPPSRFHALSNFEFSDKYLTPRGMIVHNSGLTFQWLGLGLFNIYKGDSIINDVTLVGGLWNDFSSGGVSQHAPFGSKPKVNWVEIDPIAGISTTIGKNFKLDVTYTAFNMQILDIGTSQHLEAKLSFDDGDYLKAFALHPYVSFWKELDGKATAAQVPFIVFAGKSGPGPSHYFEAGVAPSYTFKDIGLKLEAPCRVLLPDKDFYGEYFAKASTVGLWEVGLKATVPLSFIPREYGGWSFHAGFKYMDFVDKNLQGLQVFNAPGKAVKDTAQIYCGFTAFF